LARLFLFYRAVSLAWGRKAYYNVEGGKIDGNSNEEGKGKGGKRFGDGN
jgi:hypothetical protein